MAISKVKIGHTGEELAVRFLKHAGYDIVARNYCVRGGEIDIVAKKENVLVFVEVKSQRSQNFGDAETWVDERKQKRIGEAAERYLMEHQIEDVDCRFDVIAIDLGQKPPRIKHIPDAFWLEE